MGDWSIVDLLAVRVRFRHSLFEDGVSPRSFLSRTAHYCTETIAVWPRLAQRSIACRISTRPSLISSGLTRPAATSLLRNYSVPPPSTTPAATGVPPSNSPTPSVSKTTGNGNGNGSRWRSFLQTLGRVTLGTLLISGGAFYYVTQRDRHPGIQLPHDDSKKTLLILGSGWGATSLLKVLDTSEWNVVCIRHFYQPCKEPYSLTRLSCHRKTSFFSPHYCPVSPLARLPLGPSSNASLSISAIYYLLELVFSYSNSLCDPS